MSEPIKEEEQRKKVSYVGAPAVFKLELAVKHLNKAFNSYGVYMVGSALERPDWRDVDLRMIMADEEFYKEFPGTEHGWWGSDPRWLLLTVSISDYLSKASGLPVDFQFQPQTHANEHYTGRRNPMGMKD
jgi:hypothetical protein